MRRLTSVFAHVLPAVAALGLLVTAPALAQTPQGVVDPTFQSAVAPTPAPPGQGRQPDQRPLAQQGQAATPPAVAPRPEPRAPYLGNSAINAPMSPATNIRLDLTITDTFTGAPVKKTVSLIVLTQNGGMIRTASPEGWAVLNIDVVAGAYLGGLVSVRLSFEYTPALPKDIATTGRPPKLNESITVVLQDGKPLVVSQSADPSTDRKVTAELTATILK